MKHSMKPTILPANAERLQSATASLKAARATVDRNKRREALIATRESETAAREYAALRKEVLNISVLPDLIASELFELKELGKDERILIQTRKRGKYNVRTIDHHGAPPKDEWVFPDTQQTYDVYKVSTDEVFYPVDSLIQGNLDASERVNEDLGFDYSNHIDSDAWTVFLSAFGTFPAGTYDRHTRINSANMPTTNVINSSGEGAITITVMKNLLKHMVLAGRRVRTIYLSPQDLPDIWDWTPVAVASGSVDDVVTWNMREQIFNNGVINQLFGYTIMWKTVNTLPTGTMYVSTDQPSGTLYYKPDFERSELYTERECRAFFRRPGFEAVYMQGAIKPLITAPQRLNSAKVIFA